MHPKIQHIKILIYQTSLTKRGPALNSLSYNHKLPGNKFNKIDKVMHQHWAGLIDTHNTKNMVKITQIDIRNLNCMMSPTCLVYCKSSDKKKFRRKIMSIWS